MSTLHLTRGIPGSGKTTFAKRWVAEDPANRVRVNRDDTRKMVHPEHAGSATEHSTTVVSHAAIRSSLRDGKDVIVDDTNLNAGNVKRLLGIARATGSGVEWHDFEVAVDEAKTRDYRRGSTVGPDVIDKFARYLGPNGDLPERPSLDEPPKFAPYVAPAGKPKAVIVDIDGTLACNPGHRSFYDVGESLLFDTVHKPIAALVEQFIESGHRIILVSGRDEVAREFTEQWFVNNDMLFGHGAGWDALPPLFMREHGDRRDDAIVKLELFDQHIREHFDVRYVLDDRNRVVAAWRSIGLTVLQVADGDF